MSKKEKTMTTKRLSTKQLVEMALLVAIILIMAFTPIGYIKTLGLEITLIVVPVAVGAITLGPFAGAILGGVFGLTSFIQCFGLSPFGAMLLGINPIATFMITVVVRIVVGFLTGVLYKGLKRTKVNQSVSIMLANLACPLLNTLLFMSTLVLFFYKTEYIKGFVEAFGTTNVFSFVVAFVGINGVIEAIICFVIGSAVTKALQLALKN